MNKYFVHPDIAKAETISKDVYLNADVFEDAKEKMSRFYKHGRYSVTRETGTHHFHLLLADIL